jgi:CheY-like chemotaxis protein
MDTFSLRNCRILVAEDEYMLADDLVSSLRDAGAKVLGPVGTVARAADLVAREPRIDGAILDINLSGDTIFPVADSLIERGIGVVFTTGYDQSAIPDRYADIPRCEKPVSMRQLACAIGRIIEAA